MAQPASRDSATAVLSFAGMGLCLLVLSFLPVDHDYFHRALLGGTMSGAIMFTWISGGLGIYGVIRYPSRRMLVALSIALVSAAMTGARFWHTV